MDDPLLGAEPSKLCVSGEPLPELARRIDEFGDRSADDERAERIDGRDDDLRSAADRERKTVSGDPIAAVRLEDHVSRRVVGVRIHRIGAVQVMRRRKTNVERSELGDDAGNPHCYFPALHPPSITRQLPVAMADASAAK